MPGATDHDGVTQHCVGAWHVPARTRALHDDRGHCRVGRVVGGRPTDSAAEAGDLGAIVERKRGRRAVAGAQHHSAINASVAAEGVLTAVEHIVGRVRAGCHGERYREGEGG